MKLLILGFIEIFGPLISISRGGKFPFCPSCGLPWLTLMLANTQHLFQHYCGVGHQLLNWSSPGKLRMHFDLTRHQSNGHCKVGSLIHRVKCDCSVQRIRTNTKKSDCIKARHHMLLDFLHLSRNRYVFFLNRASNAGMLHWTWWVMTTNTSSPGQVV